MVDPEDLPVCRHDEDESGSVLVWSVTGLVLVFAFVLALVLLRPHP